LRSLVLFTVIVAAGTGGELCVSRAMKSVVGMSALAFFALLGALSIYNVSFVVPVTALSYVAGALGGVVFLNERVNTQRWIGVVLVAIGVVLVFLGKS
jgi:drug/metabolite transporter (DMT)-like permease